MLNSEQPLAGVHLPEVMMKLCLASGWEVSEKEFLVCWTQLRLGRGKRGLEKRAGDRWAGEMLCPTRSLQKQLCLCTAALHLAPEVEKLPLVI